jgi:Xaa-Pro aminopeptidase
MPKWSFVLALSIVSILACAQSNQQPADLLTADFHKSRRAALRTIMPQKSVAVFFANPERNRANDVSYRYHQDPNFYYLTGSEEPSAVLLVFKDMQTITNETFNEIIFVRPHQALKEMYDGVRLGREGARDQLKFKVAYEGTDFKNYPIDFSSYEKVMFYDFFDDVRDLSETADLYELIEQFKEKVGYQKKEMNVTIEPRKNNIDLLALDLLMKKLRGIKTPEEIQLLRTAVNISTVGQLEVMKSIRPGMSEMQIQGLHEFIHKSYAAADQGYGSIVGAGHNGCVLHYVDNEKASIEDGDLILMDVGAEYRGYSADITRTIPINGKFTKEQKIIYDLVYKAQEATRKICKEGVSFKTLEQTANGVINEGLVALGLYKSIDKKDMVDPATGRNRYNPHGCCHHIGLDVHDKGEYDELKEGMVITIEPGIYIRNESTSDKIWWNIPVRIEDDFLVQKEGCELLSTMAPRKSEEIEKVMLEPGAFDNLKLPEVGIKK